MSFGQKMSIRGRVLIHINPVLFLRGNTEENPNECPPGHPEQQIHTWLKFGSTGSAGAGGVHAKTIFGLSQIIVR